MTRWPLHDDTNKVGLRKLYLGTTNSHGCDKDEGADCHGPEQMYCYWGAF